jgi:hypothetical protein
MVVKSRFILERLRAYALRRALSTSATWEVHLGQLSLQAFQGHVAAFVAQFSSGNVATNIVISAGEKTGLITGQGCRWACDALLVACCTYPWPHLHFYAEIKLFIISVN